MTSHNRFWLAILAAFFIAMLGASLWQRFTHPDLTISRSGEIRTEEDAASAGIGRLMEAAAKNPGDRALLLQLVESLLAVGQLPGAENFAQKALALDKPGEENSRTLYLLAVVRHNQGRHAEAAELLEKLLAKEENGSARYSLAILNLHYLHNIEAGIDNLEKGLQVPGIPAALEKSIRDELSRARAMLPPPTSQVEP